MTDAHPAIPLEVAVVQADQLVTVGLETGAFRRAEVAGSVRRRKPQVHDIEVVAEPGDYFGGVPAFLASIGVVRGQPNKAGARAPWSGKYFKAEFTRGMCAGVQLDLFLVSKDLGNEWGPIFAIRTGDRHFSQGVVTRLQRYGLQSQDGQVHVVKDSVRAEHGGAWVVPCPTEERFFELAHLPTLEPRLRDWDNPHTRALVEGP